LIGPDEGQVMTTAIEKPRTSWHGALMSVEEFLALPDDGIHRELIQGKVREDHGDAVEPARGTSMTVRNRIHSRIDATVTYHLVHWLKQQTAFRGEVVCGEAGFRLDGTPESLVGIDVAVVSAEMVAGTDSKQKVYDGPPVLAVEILSPNDTQQEIVVMVSSYLNAGCIVWVLDPDFETVAVHRPGLKPVLFNSQQELSGEPSLPGFRVSVAELFR
jgi:Uma2 family endonuclease